MWHVIGIIIAGIIIGLLGKWIAPSNRDNIPLWLTVICGVAGVLVGYWLAGLFGVSSTGGVDWVRWIISVVVAVIFVVIASSVMARRGASKVSH
jgi:uncharacterized membrane protein YeaQ/YmgE (transglycosylase-associated protein family)